MIQEKIEPTAVVEKTYDSTGIVESAKVKLNKLFKIGPELNSEEVIRFRFTSSFFNGKSNGLFNVQETFDENSTGVLLKVSEAAIEILEKENGVAINPFVKTDFLSTIKNIGEVDFNIAASQGLELFGATSNYSAFEVEVIFQNGISEERNTKDALVDIAFSYNVGISPMDEHQFKFEMGFKRFHLFRRPLKTSHLM